MAIESLGSATSVATPLARSGKPDVGGSLASPVRDDTVVTFVTTIGRIEPAEAKTRDGKATVTLFGNGQSGTAKVTAFSGAAFANLDIEIIAAGVTARR